MKAVRRVATRLCGSLPWRRNDARVREELEEHLELATDDFVRVGLPRGEARRRARLRLGAPGAIEETYRDQPAAPRASIRRACYVKGRMYELGAQAPDLGSHIRRR
ncbi:MAG: hypothetical protein ABS36_13815 [Acidobacteria bacterium SCN 69-37]|nr:MAG: hypothetical protein ABS36_13815 [Acidobacteria bacterium SCN 69-37]